MSSTPCISVVVAYQGPPGRAVALAGDFPSWSEPRAMTEVAPGEYRCALELAPGLYRYRFLVDWRRYVSDPRPQAVDRAEGYDNALLIVGGATPPLYHAPDRRHVARHQDGRLVVLAEVEQDAPAPSHVWLRIGAPAPAPGAPAAADCTLPLVRERCRNGRQQLRAEGTLEPGLQGSYGFAGSREAFVLPPARSLHGAPPAWLDNAVFYAIFVDRWRRGSRSEADPRARPRDAASTPAAVYGGDLDGIRESLGEIEALGVDALVLTPVHRSDTPHRYDALDLLEVDPRLGGSPALARLAEACHARGLKLVVDLAVTHVAQEHAAFQDLLARQRSSPHTSWFMVHRFPVRAGDGETYAYYRDRPELPRLNLGAGPAREHSVRAALRLLEHGIDGLRLDAMGDAPADYWRELRARLRAARPDLLLMGEVVDDRPVRFAEEAGADTATDFQHREAMVRLFARGEIDAAEFVEQVGFAEHRLGPFDPCFRLLFLDNHDTARFLSLAGDSRRLHLALCYLLFRPEPAWLTYGIELDLCAGADLGIALDDAWPERLPVPERGSGAATPTALLIAGMTALRRSLRGLPATPLEVVEARGPRLVLARPARQGRLLACFNLDPDQWAPPPITAPAAVLCDTARDRGSAAGPLPPLSARVVLATLDGRTDAAGGGP